MKQNQIYLSDHEPEIVSYCIIYNHYGIEKMDLNISDECAETREVQRALGLISNVQKCEFQEFYTEVSNGDYLLACALIPLIHEIRENFLKLLNNKKRVAV